MQEQRSGTYLTPCSLNAYCSFLMALKFAVELLQSLVALLLPAHHSESTNMFRGSGPTIID